MLYARKWYGCGEWMSGSTWSAKERARRMNMKRASLFVFTRLELVLFITDGLWADCLAAGWGHNKVMCLPKAERLGHKGLNGPVMKRRAYLPL